MRTRIQLLALGLVLVLVTSVGGAQVGLAPNSAPTSDETGANPTVDTEASSANATTIDSCRVINESGHYELAENLSGHERDECIDIRASDVVLDGNGHTIDALDMQGVRVNGTENPHNVTVRDLRIHGLIAASAGTTGIVVENATDVTVSNVTVEDAYMGIDVNGSSQVVIQNITATGEESTHGSSSHGILTTLSSHVIIEDSVVRTFQHNIAASGRNVTIRDNVVYQTYLAGEAGRHGAGITISASNSTVRQNEVRPVGESTGFGITLAGNATGTHITENTISFGGDIGVRVNTSGTANTSNVVANNTIESADVGVYVVQISNPLDIEYNEFSNTKKGIRINHRASCYGLGEGADVISVHWNSFVGTQVGINNLDDGVVNATQNYWGASNGPSSANDTDAPFEDPETGTLADGDGGAVSEDPNEDGVSNVHFDTWLDEPPAEAGVSTNETASA